MSGGSLDYLCFKESSDLPQCLGLLAQAIEDCPNVEFRNALSDLRRDVLTSIGRWESHWRRMKPVLKALEWWESGDSSRQEFEREPAKWLDCETPAIPPPSSIDND